jgi:hypothetical protein
MAGSLLKFTKALADSDYSDNLASGMGDALA